MKYYRWATSALAVSLILGGAGVQPSRAQQPQQEQKITDFDRVRARDMLARVYDTLKKNYYDQTFHGLDIDARYKTYDERLKSAQTLAQAFRTIAAFLTGLDDSHTYFQPPSRSYRFTYGYLMEMVGDNCFITEVRPDTDAAKKLHPGDQILSLDGYTINRKDLWQLEYFLNRLAPKPTHDLSLRGPSGNTRKEVIYTKYQEGQLLTDLTLQHQADFGRLMLEEEERHHRLRQRYVEQGDVIIWKMPAFSAEATEIDRVVGVARKHKALILDLRGNPGGREDSLLRVIGNLFDHDVKIGTRVTRKGEKPMVAKSRGGEGFSGKLTVLVDSRSASAAEVVARVVQLEHRGTVMGDRSSGSVMGAMFYAFQAGVDIAIFYGAAITSDDLIMPDGRSLEKVGVTPDIIILPTAADLAAGHDPVLARAAELAGIQLDPAAAGKLFPFEWSPL
ncbi:MAG TPA: S41 family peptidase [Candidatus Acidoferrales bacterium]|nr:S41 family peptidase [Candidatus Acidoferrales bacterium]